MMLLSMMKKWIQLFVVVSVITITITTTTTIFNNSNNNNSNNVVTAFVFVHQQHQPLPFALSNIRQQQQQQRTFITSTTSPSSSSKISITTTTALGYEPKWKKKETLAEQVGVVGTVKDLKEIGLIGTIPVRFQQGNVTKTTMALPGQPLREVAIQAGQFIKYGCGKGECGTCEALVNGQWIRPCSVNVPYDIIQGEEYVVQVKEVKNKARSSGKFYSVRSFLYGFYNNVLGMVGMVTYKRNAKRNYLERMEYEDLIRQKALEKKRLKALELVQQKK